MTGDVLLIRRRHRLAARKLADIILTLVVDRPVIAISGESGSGKSELSHSIGKIFKQRGIKVKLITTDDFYQTLPAERTAKRLEKGIPASVGPQEYDWVKLSQTVKDYKNKQTSVLPCVDLINDQVDKLTVDFRDIEILIFDGLYAIMHEDADLKVIIDIPYTKTKLAQLKRGKEPMDQTRLEILKAEHKAILGIKKMAHYIINENYNLMKSR